MKNITIEKMIRAEFPGKSNAGLRAELRKRWREDGASALWGVSRYFGLTSCGLASLKTIANAAKELEDADSYGD